MNNDLSLKDLSEKKYLSYGSILPRYTGSSVLTKNHNFNITYRYSGEIDTESSKVKIYIDNLEIFLLLSVDILNYDVSAAFIYGKIRSETEKDGNIISNTDIQIASIAISNNPTLITGNIKQFQSIKNLRAENQLM